MGGLFSELFVEGWHNGFQQLVGHSKPNIWTFLKALIEGGHADFRQESQDDEPGSSSSTAEEVALVQPKSRCCSGRL